MLDRFDSTTGSKPDPAAGLYRQNTPLSSDTNRHIAGGRMIGFTEDLPWSGPSQLPWIAPENEGEIDAGRIAFRGSGDDMDRVVFRRFTVASPQAVEYFGMVLETNTLAPDGLAFIAWSEPTQDSQANGRAFLAGEGFTQGFAFGFRGNGNGGMDLVVRYRDENVTPVEKVLVENVAKDTPYEIVCRVEWDLIPRGESPRDRVTVWVNPGETEEASEPVEFTATSGTSGTLSMVLLLQRRFGQDTQNAFFVDDIWLGEAFTDRPSLQK